MKILCSNSKKQLQVKTIPNLTAKSEITANTCTKNMLR